APVDIPETPSAPEDPDSPGTPGGNPGEPTEIDTADPNPDLTFVKTVKLTGDANSNEEADFDDELTYTFTVENTGNVTLSNVGLTDEMVGLENWNHDWPATEGKLLPGEVYT